MRQYFPVFGQYGSLQGRHCVTLLLCLDYFAFKVNTFLNIIPASFYHFTHPMQRTWPDLQLVLNIHERIPIYISSRSVWNVTISSIHSKQICYFWLGTVHKTKTQHTITEIKVTFCHYKVHFKTAWRMHERKDSLQENDMSHWIYGIKEAKHK